MLAMATRRDVLSLAMGAATASATASAVTAFARRRSPASSSWPLRPVADETTGAALLKLPGGFSYRTFSWSLEGTDDGHLVSGLHDGMGAFPSADGRTVTLVRNHEITLAPLLAPDPAYDPRCGGGTTTLTFDLAGGEWLSSCVSLAGTYKNCSGGPTPWGSWLSCEETVADPATHAVERPHGFVFEVPADAPGDPRPLADLGRFEHEAAAVDPATGIVYLTEDESRAGLYRFLPKAPGDLRAGGRLQMLAIDGRPNFRGLWRQGLALSTAWVDIDDPTAAEGWSTFRQGFAKGAMRFSRLEGCWLEAGRLYFASTDGGVAGKGQIWELAVAEERLRLLYESPGRETLDMPDNLVGIGSGALLLCEDGGAPTRLRLLTPAGEVRTVAENAIELDGLKGFRGDYRGGEWCGVCHVGNWVFANLQEPGITFAITGPWQDLLGA